jgi:dephospho-CoA kinase
MKLIGLTGGIGSGKTLVSSLLEEYNMAVYSCDEESKKLITEDANIRERLINLLGEEIYDENGLNRKVMANIIFNDETILKQVNEIIRPEVNKHFKEWVKQQTAEFVICESAILFETNFSKDMDFNITVYAPIEVRLERAMKRDGATEEQILKRMGYQMTDEHKMTLADFVIYNSGIETIKPQIEELLDVLNAKKY